MSTDTQTGASTGTNGQAPTWADRVTPVFAEVATFLHSRRKTLTISADISGEVWDTTDEPQTYTRDEVKAGAITALTHMVGRKDTDGMTKPTDMGAPNMAKWLRATSTHSGKSKLICLKAMSSVCFQAKRAYKAARLSTAVSGGTHWYADGVVWYDSHERAGEPREFVSRRKAVSAYLRANVDVNWSTLPNKAELKDMALAHVRQGTLEAPTAQENREAQQQARATPQTPAKPAPVATQSSVKVTKAELVERAVACGMTKKAANSMRKAKLEKTVGALEALK